MNISTSDKAVVLSYEEHEELMKLKESTIDKTIYENLENKYKQLQKTIFEYVPKQHYEQAVKNYYDVIYRNSDIIKKYKEKIEVLSKNITNNKIAVSATYRNYNACSSWITNNTFEVNDVEVDEEVVKNYLKTYAEQIEKNKYKNMSIFDFIKFRKQLRKEVN